MRDGKTTEVTLTGALEQGEGVSHEALVTWEALVHASSHVPSIMFPLLLCSLPIRIRGNISLLPLKFTCAEQDHALDQKRFLITSSSRAKRLRSVSSVSCDRERAEN